MRLSELFGRKAPKYTGFTDENGVRHTFDPPADSAWEALGRANNKATSVR